MRRLFCILALLAFLLLPGGGGTATSPGHVVYTLLANHHVYRLPGVTGSAPEDLTFKLNASSKGRDEWANLAPDGRWLLLSTERFGCAGWACLAVVSSDLKVRSAIKVGTEFLHSDGFSAIASGGALVVYPSNDGPHGQDLWAVSKVNGVWTKPRLLTGKSPSQYNAQPAVSADKTRVLFDCGSVPYAGAPTQICSVASAGGTVTVAVKGATNVALHHPDLAPDGSIVFEGGWQGEAIWRLPPGAAKPVKVSKVGDDNSPCVLPDGRIVSLWLERPGSKGYHEIKVMKRDGTGSQMLLTGKDVLDSGIGCGL